ncbi:hypothetical protein [Kribbella sp. NPDC049584]|uniref:hypothetical protein n=1 Tax=Kribbella sp. NPDC049584 TaxID=3154833 RepID=UPI003444DFF0
MPPLAGPGRFHAQTPAAKYLAVWLLTAWLLTAWLLTAWLLTAWLPTAWLLAVWLLVHETDSRGNKNSRGR